MYDRKELLKACFNLGLAVLDVQMSVIGAETEEYELYKTITEELNKPDHDLPRVDKLMGYLRALLNK